MKFYPVEDQTIEKGKYPNPIILGYGHLNNGEINEDKTRPCRAINKSDI